MSGLLSLLQNSAMSLQAHQAYSSTVAHNLSNANTPGYARQRADMATTLPADYVGGGFVGRGVTLAAISQSRDRFLEAQMPDALSRQSMSSAQAQALQTLNVLDIDAGIGPALGNFYSSMRALAQNAGNLSLREGAVNAGKQLALAFNRTSTAIDSARNGIDARIDGKIPEINDKLAELVRLNVQVRHARATGAEPNDLLDARQRLADDLASTLGAQQVANKEGHVNLVLSNGTPLAIGERASVLSAVPDPSNGGHLELSIILPDGTGPRELNAAIGGEFGGLLAARDTNLASSETAIDTMAFDLANALNVVHQSGFALDGTSGRDLFTVSATATGAAGSLAINVDLDGNASLLGASSSAATVPGDGIQAQAMVATESLALSSGANVTSTLAHITTTFGTATQRAMSANQGDRSMLEHLTNMRQSVSGVSVDEELVNMTRAQRAFEAVAKVIQTTDSLLETLMSLK